MKSPNMGNQETSLKEHPTVKVRLDRQICHHGTVSTTPNQLLLSEMQLCMLEPKRSFSPMA